MPLDIKAPPEEVTRRIVEHDLRHCVSKLRRVVERMRNNPTLYTTEERAQVHWTATQLETLASRLAMENGTP